MNLSEPNNSMVPEEEKEEAELLEVQSVEPLFTPTSAQTIMCAICSLRTSLYKCPGCSITTCSCECVKQHKIKSGCNGKRNRAAFVEKSGFTEKNLRSDYHFLEDTLQMRTSAKRTAGKSFGGGLTNKTIIKSAEDSAHTIEEVMRGQQQQKGGPQLSQSAAKLVKGAKDHGVELALMPTGMSKRKNNTSSYHKKEDKIFWKVHINFILSNAFDVPSVLSCELHGLSASGALMGLSSEPRHEVAEETLLRDVMAGFLETTSANLSNRHHLRSLRASKAELQCFLQHIPSPSLRPLFVQLSPDSSLRDCLRGKKVIEYPTLVVGVQAHTSCLSLMIREVTDCPAPAPAPALTTSVSTSASASGSSAGMSVHCEVALRAQGVSPSGTGADAVVSPNKRRQVDELSCSAKKIRLGAAASVEMQRRTGLGASACRTGGTDDSVDSAGGEKMEEDDEDDYDDDDDDDDDDEGFLQQLVDLETADISSLQSLIRSLEEDQ